MSLYNKYRPNLFREIVSQEVTITAIKEQLKNDRFSQAYIMAGTRGTGKTTTSKLFSKYVTCESPSEGEPCDVCGSCIDAKAGRHSDIYEIDGASNNSVDHVRTLIDEIKYPPMRSKYKVYIIDEVHMLSGSAFNALLKTLEEPPAHVIFILATTELHKVPATIRSRCQIFTFAQIEVRDISAHLLKITNFENINLSEEGARLIAENTDGSMRDGISILEQLSHNALIDTQTVEKALGLINEKHTYSFVEFLIDRDIENAIAVYKEIMKQGKTTSQLIESMIRFLTGAIMCGDRVGEMSSTLKKLIEFKRNVQKESNIQLLFNLFIVDACTCTKVIDGALEDTLNKVDKRIYEIESFIKKVAKNKSDSSETPKTPAISDIKAEERPLNVKEVQEEMKQEPANDNKASVQNDNSELKKANSERVQSLLGRLNKFQAKV